MSLTIDTLAPGKGSRTKRFRVGRGAGSGSGKTAGRGTKGQRSRTGGRSGLKLKGLKQMLLGFPKIGGFRSRYSKAATIPLSRLEQFKDGETVDIRALKKAGFMNRSDRSAKIVGTGKLTKKLIIRGMIASATAKQAIEAAGGSLPKPAKKKKTGKKNAGNKRSK